MASQMAPFEPATVSRRAPSGARPAMMRPRASAVRSRATHLRRTPCNAPASGHKQEEDCAIDFVNELIKDAVDEDVSETFAEMTLDYETDEEQEDYDEVLSLSADDEESEEDMEMESFHYVHMACNFAKKVVDQGIELEMKKAEVDLEAVRLEARAALIKAATDGSLKDALQNLPAPKEEEEEEEELDMDALKMKALSALLNLVDDEDEEDDEEEAQAALFDEEAMDEVKAARVSQHIQAMQEEEEAAALEALRLQAAQALLSASADGRLERVLQEQKKALQDDVQELRMQARDAILSAAQDGRLSAALKKRKVEHLRLQARSVLLEASKDGRLEQALKTRQAMQQTEELRALARQTLVQAAKDGRLTESLKEMAAAKEAAQVEESRHEVRECLLKGAMDGSLARVLKERYEAKKAEEVEALRSEARECLLKGAMDGNLARVLKERYEAKKAEEVEALRSEARESLLKGAMDGSLERVLKETHEAKKAVKEAKSMARSILLKAAEDGRLLKAFEERSAAKKEEAAVEQMKLEVRSALVNAARSGVLAAALEKSNEERAQREEATQQRPTKVQEETPLSKPVLEDLSTSLAEKLDRLDRPVSPASGLKTPGRTKRRVIGGVERSVSQASFEKNAWAMAGSPAGGLRRFNKDSAFAPIAFRLDSDDSVSEKPGLTRKPSLTAMFEAMGSAELYRMDSGDAEDDLSSRKMSQKLPPSRQGMRKSASASAMAMDLGLQDFESRASTPMSRVSSVGALRAIKMNKGSKQVALPQLNTSGLASEWGVGSATSMSMTKSRAWGTVTVPPAF